MAASEIATLSGVILQIASFIQTAGNNWYRASADWTDFPRKVEHLRKNHLFWLDRLTEYGLLSDKSLMEALRAAEVPLREEQERLSRRQSKSGAKWLSKLSMATFPAKIGLRIQRVTDGFDAMMYRLDYEEKVDLALEKRVMRRAASLAIRKDDRYVPLTISEAEVYSKLDHPLCPQVVLLHGFPGKGKSTLALQTALHYSTAKSDRFERVVFLEFGREADLETKQFELLQQLGPSAPQEQLSGATIRRRLSNFLKHQKLLIILDDVWDGEFLRRMVDLCGVGVRCLVTSQRADLCQDCSSCTSIRIEDPHNEAAMKILASHVGFRNKEIPSHIQERAKKIIEKCQGHPLALATIATAIDSDRSDDLEEWDGVYDNFLHVLHSTEDTASILGKKHSKSFWTTMQLSIQSLGVNARKLLILVHMCAGPSVPEEVLRSLYTRAVVQADFEAFNKARRELASRDLIKIIHNVKSWLTLGPLLNLFMEKEMKDGKESMFTVLVPGPSNTESIGKPDINADFVRNNDAMIQTAICALYFDKPFSARAASNMDIPSDRLNDLRRNAIEPITRLLGRSISERWTAASQASAEQVFWTYISNCALHNDGILHLLALPKSISEVLTALNDIATLEVTCLFDTNSQGFIKALSNLLEDHSTSTVTIAVAAARAILQLSLNLLHVKILISCGILDAVLRTFSSKYHPDIKETLLEILRSICNCTGSAEMIVQYPGTLALLVKSLSHDDSYILQLSATRLLERLAGSTFDEDKRMIIQLPGALEHLIRLLSKDALPKLQEHATMALYNLANGIEDAKRTIIHFPGVLEQLIRLLSKDALPQHQRQAARALANLANLNSSANVPQSGLGDAKGSSNNNIRSAGTFGSTSSKAGEGDVVVEIPKTPVNSIIMENLGKASSGSEFNHNSSLSPSPLLAISPTGVVSRSSLSPPIALQQARFENGAYNNSSTSPTSFPTSSSSDDSKDQQQILPESPLDDLETLASSLEAIEVASEDAWRRDVALQKVVKMVGPFEKFEELCPPGGEGRVVMYVTTMRAIRKTFGDCNNMKLVIMGYGVAINERNVSMHPDFRQELKDLLGKRPMQVPRLFIKGRYIGGAEQVSLLHEDGTLAKLLETMPPETSLEKCDRCGDHHFVPCHECSGSCKVINEDDQVTRCTECNENGLVRCPICF